MTHCHLCNTDVPSAELLGHLVDHGFDDLERWPDGDVVVVDRSARTVDDALEVS